MIAPDGTDLGKALYEHKNRFVCERGICDKKNSILWKDIEEIFLSAFKEYAIIIPKYERLDVIVRSKKGKAISLKLQSIGVVNKSKKENLFDSYEFIVSKVIDRQLEELSKDINVGKRVSFGSFDITADALYRKKLFGGHDVIKMDRLAGHDIANGEFIIEYIDDNGRIKRKNSGYVYEVPNIHLAQTMLSSIAKKNFGS